MSAIAVKNRPGLQIFLLSFPVVILLAVGKDLLHSIVKDYHFYLSESLLFETFWLLFAPLGLVGYRVAKRHGGLLFNLFFPLLGSLLHISIFSMLVFSVSALFFNHTFGAARIFTESLADHGMACLFIYSAAIFVSVNVQKKPRQFPKTAAKIRVTYQNKTLFLKSQNILYVKTERPYIALVTRERTYLHSDSLQGFLGKNRTDNFIRIHKSTVVNTNAITSYRSRQNGDYDVDMTNGETLRASRNYNSYFRRGS